MSKTLEHRFGEKCWHNPGTGCIEWMAYRCKLGYGKIKVGSSALSAHRVAYEIQNGRPPKHLVIDHVCRNTSCVNPEHLEAVTQHENVLRGEARAAANAAKTHCDKGHPLAGVSLYQWKNKRNGRTMRQCRACHRIYTRNKARHERKRALYAAGVLV